MGSKVGQLQGPAREVAFEEGMVVTVESSTYINGWGGSRIEDDAV